MSDPINPDHYQLPGGIQVHELIGVVLERDIKFQYKQSYADFSNVLKYALRIGAKGDPLEQLGKMKWYLDKIVEREGHVAVSPETGKKPIPGTLDFVRYMDHRTYYGEY